MVRDGEKEIKEKKKSLLENTDFSRGKKKKTPASDLNVDESL